MGDGGWRGTCFEIVQKGCRMQVLGPMLWKAPLCHTNKGKARRRWMGRPAGNACQGQGSVVKTTSRGVCVCVCSCENTSKRYIGSISMKWGRAVLKRTGQKVMLGDVREHQRRCWCRQRLEDGAAGHRRIRRSDLDDSELLHISKGVTA